MSNLNTSKTPQKILDAYYQTVQVKNTVLDINNSIANEGLKLGGKVIKRISGPVYLNILKPSMSFHTKFKAPIFVLFGDRHKSKENICDDCTCIDDEKSCCYEVFSDDFLRIIDNIGSDTKYPIGV